MENLLLTTTGKKMKELFCFDDFVMLPLYSEIESRFTVDTTVNIEKKDVDTNEVISLWRFNSPIISAPMSNVTDYEMCSAMGNINSMAILHRFQSLESKLEKLKKLKSEHNFTFTSVAVGVQQQDYDDLLAYIDVGVDLICVDVAHGVNIKTLKFVEHAKKLLSGTGIFLVVGSISDHTHISEYISRGLSVDGYRVGIGGGSICTTTIQTGHGVPLASSLSVIQEYRDTLPPKDNDFFIIADGGIRNSGDIVKSLYLGADFVMCGSLLAGTKESPGNYVSINDKQYKQYFGMASKENQVGKDNIYEEGISHHIPAKGYVHLEINNLMNGVRSGCSYSNCKSIYELQTKGKSSFITSNSIAERKAHIREL